mgnify:CR=1 FL=1
MKEKMIRTQVYLPRDIYIKLKKRANEEDISMAHQIREALTQHVVETETYTETGSKYSIPPHDPRWHMIGMAKHSPEDGSPHHDKYIYVSDWDPQENQT